MEKQEARKKYDHVTYLLGGLFRAELKNNPAFSEALKNAIRNNKIKTTHKDGSPMFNYLVKIDSNNDSNIPYQEIKNPS